MTRFDCATGPAEIANKCVPLTDCDVATEGITPVCSGIGATCDPDSATPGCKSGQSCATNKQCVPSDACGTTVDETKITCKGKPCDPDGDNQGCGDGFRCATAPADISHSCVAKEACDQTAAGETDETKCDARALAATILSALAIFSTM